MIKLSKKLKNELFIKIRDTEDIIKNIDQTSKIVDFINEIWDLKSMPTTNNRCENAYHDIGFHLVYNNDWDVDYVFIDKLKLIEDDEKYAKFLETIVNPKYQNTENKIISLVSYINSLIKKENYILSISDYDENNFPIYKIQNMDDYSKNDLPDNQIPFYLYSKKPEKYSNKLPHNYKPPVFPSFILNPNNWDDYYSLTSFSLFYFETEYIYNYIGDLKITDGKTKLTYSVLPVEFMKLDEKFCSLGQDIEYYQNLKKIINSKFESVLSALNDTAFFVNIYDKFKENPIFRTSLIREDEKERLLREAKPKIYKYDLKKLYSFKYVFNPKYTDESIEVDFNFQGFGDVPSRIFAIIGKNGTGKTQLISQIPNDLFNKKNEVFLPKPPLFSKIIAVSYSIFDNFEIPLKTKSFNYIYCGLFDSNKKIITETKQAEHFHDMFILIEQTKRIFKLREILLNFIDENIITEFIYEDKSTFSFGEEYRFNSDNFDVFKNKLSSGQAILLYIISEIISNIRYDSLLLFDEPETHLHPNAISQLMNVIYKLVDEFQSYCIITTHSPLIIQEILSKNVYVLEKSDNTPLIRKIGFESFGENLTVLTEEVFGNKEIKRHYKKIIDELIIKGLTYENIVSNLTSDEIPLSLNAKLYIKSKLKE